MFVDGHLFRIGGPVFSDLGTFGRIYGQANTRPGRCSSAFGFAIDATEEYALQGPAALNLKMLREYLSCAKTPLAEVSTTEFTYSPGD